MSDNQEKEKNPQKTAAGENQKKSGGPNPLFSLVRTVLILAAAGYLVWTVVKGNPKVRDMIDRLAAAQQPAAKAMISASGESMGTFWNVKIFDPPKGWDESKITSVVQPVLDHVDGLMSTYKPDSEISRFNHSESTDWFSVSAETARVVGLAQEIAEKTEGALDITVGPLVNFWKFGPDKTPLTEFPSEDVINAVRAKTGYQNLEVRLDPPALKKRIPELCLDLSAVAKGFSVDVVSDALKNEKAANFMVDVGGETYCYGTKGEVAPGKPVYSNRWLMGIEKPVKTSPGIVSEPSAFLEERAPQFHRIVWMDNRAIATSGDAHNAFEIGGKRYSHIIDPATGKPTEMTNDASGPEVGSVSVFDESCARADALATALYVLGPDRGTAFAERLNLPVLYLLRDTQNPDGPCSEKTSSAFADIPSERTDAEVEKSRP